MSCSKSWLIIQTTVSYFCTQGFLKRKVEAILRDTTAVVRVNRLHIWWKKRSPNEKKKVKTRCWVSNDWDLGGSDVGTEG